MRRLRIEVLLVLIALPVHASEIWHDEHGATLEVSGFYKTLLSGFWLQPDSVTLARTQQSLFEQAGLKTSPLVDGGVLSAHLVRAQAKFRFADKIQLDAAWQLQLSLASSSAFVSGSALSGTVGGTSSGSQRRIVDLAGTLGSGDVWRLEHNLDRLALKIALPFGDLTIGRQVLSWGTGRLWNPTDVLSPFPPTVIDREVRRGFDAVRLAIALGEVTQLDLLYLPQPNAEDSGGVARFQTNVKGWDASLSVGKYVRDLVIGADVVGDLGPIGVHAEGAYTLEFLSTGVGEHFFRGVVGADFKPHEKVVLMAEYSYNGYGTMDPNRLAAVLTSARVIRGEIFGGGKHQAGLAVSFIATDLLSMQLALLANLTDPSALVIPSVEYSLTQQVLIRAGANLPIGRSPNPNAYATLTPTDVLTNPQAFASRGLRSEYGSSAWGAFVQLGVYLP